MTKTEMLRVAQQDGDAMVKLTQELTAAAGDQDAMLNLIEDLIAAARADAIDDVTVELRSQGMREAVQLVKSNF